MSDESDQHMRRLAGARLGRWRVDQATGDAAMSGRALGAAGR